MQKSLKNSYIQITDKMFSGYPELYKFIEKKIKEELVIIYVGKKHTFKLYVDLPKSSIFPAFVEEEYSASLSKKHNNPNILIIDEDLTSKQKSKVIQEIFINELFEGGRHQMRIDYILKGEKWK